MSFTFCVFVMHILNSEMYYITISIMFTKYDRRGPICIFNEISLERSKSIFRISTGERSK